MRLSLAEPADPGRGQGELRHRLLSCVTHFHFGLESHRVWSGLMNARTPPPTEECDQERVHLFPWYKQVLSYQLIVIRRSSKAHL